jgi:hypothetical protein
MLGNTSLHQAVLQQSASDVVWLLKSGADLNAKSWSGDTPLHLAVITRHLPTVELMLAAGADAGVENAYGCCPARLAARLSDAAAWNAITTHVAARHGSAFSAPNEPRVALRSRAPRSKPQVQPAVAEDEMRRRAAAAEAAAADLLAAEMAEKAERARKETRATTRRLKKQQQRLRKFEAAAAVVRGQDDGDRDAAEIPENARESSPELADGDDSDIGEPEWLEELLSDFCDAGTGAATRRSFVEHSVRLCASLKLQMETFARCIVCLDGARGTLLQPCGHTSLCRMCAARVTDGEAEEERRCPVCAQGVTGWTPAFL